MQEPSDQLLPYNRFVLALPLCFNWLSENNFVVTVFGFGSELLVIFLKFLYDQDPVRQLLEASDADQVIDIDL